MRFKTRKTVQYYGNNLDICENTGKYGKRATILEYAVKGPCFEGPCFKGPSTYAYAHEHACLSGNANRNCNVLTSQQGFATRASGINFP